MAEKRFSKGEAIGLAWQKVTDNLGFFIGLGVILACVNIIPGIFSEFTKKTMPLVSILITLGSMIISFLITPGIIKIFLDFCDGKQAHLDDLLSYPNLFFRYAGAMILYSLAAIGILIVTTILIFCIGFITKISSSNFADTGMGIFFIYVLPIGLVIVFTMFLLVKLQFFPYFLVDKNTGAVESLKKSYAMTKGLGGELLIFAFVLGLINLLGFLCLIIGLFVSIPTTSLATAYVYRKLVSQQQPAIEASAIIQ